MLAVKGQSFTDAWMKRLPRADPVVRVPVQREYPKLHVSGCVLLTLGLPLPLLEPQHMAELHLLNALTYINIYTHTYIYVQGDCIKKHSFIRLRS